MDRCVYRGKKYLFIARYRIFVGVSLTFTQPASAQYVAGVTRPARESGPWGEALNYWLEQRDWSQADLVRIIQKREEAVARREQMASPGQPKRRTRRIQPNTISRVARGLHTQTAVLERIAHAIGIPLADLLVSPLRREEWQQRAEVVMRRVMLEMAAPPAPPTVDTVATDFARQVEELDEAEQQHESDKRTAAATKAAAKRPHLHHKNK